MISSFFSKSKPIHSIIVIVLITLVFVLTKFRLISNSFNVYFLIEQLGILLLIIFSVFILDFIISKNNLTQKNSYTILIFTLLIAVVPQSLISTKIILANLFVLFALRRLISLHSKLHVKKKLLDATFWIALASLCFFWSILFMIVIFFALLYHSQNDIKNWFIPPVGLIMVAIIVSSYSIIVEDTFIPFEITLLDFSLDFSSYNNPRLIGSITLILTVIIWTSIVYIKQIREKTGKLKPAYMLVGIAVLVGFAVALISPIKTGSEFLFLFAPLAIMMTIYLEKIQDIRFKETLVWLLVLTPIVLLVL